MHPKQYHTLKETIIPQAVYFAEEKEIVVNSRNIRVNGCIKSSVPPCDGRASVTASTSDKLQKQNLCKHCYIQYKYLQSLTRKRKHAALETGQRQNSNGMRRSYLTKQELNEKEHLEKRARLEKPVMQSRMHRSEKEWLRDLEECCRTSNQQKFIIDCLDLFKHRDAQSFDVQMAVLHSVGGTLRNGRNHHYSSIIKRVARMSKNWLGANNYSKIQVLFMRK